MMLSTDFVLLYHPSIGSRSNPDEIKLLHCTAHNPNFRRNNEGNEDGAEAQTGMPGGENTTSEHLG